MSDNASQVDKKPEPKPSAKQERPLHARFAHLVADLAVFENMPLEARGAALFLAHLCTEHGRDKVLAMKATEVRKHLLSFRARYPLACQALDVCDVVRFVYRLDMYEVEHDDDPTLRRAILDILPPPPKPDVDMAAIAAQAAALQPAASRP